MNECINCGKSPANNDPTELSNWCMDEYKGTFMCDKCFQWEKRMEDYEHYTGDHSIQDYISTILHLQDKYEKLKNSIVQVDNEIKKWESELFDKREETRDKDEGICYLDGHIAGLAGALVYLGKISELEKN